MSRANAVVATSNRCRQDRPARAPIPAPYRPNETGASFLPYQAIPRPVGRLLRQTLPSPPEPSSLVLDSPHSPLNWSSTHTRSYR